MDINNIWINQVYNYGLGNTINLMPTIKLMADHFDKPIPMYFDLKFIEQCFIDCPFIEILEKKPDNQSLFGSWLTNGRNDVPDYINVYREVCKAIPLGSELPHTYVDCTDIEVKEKNYILFIRGSGNETNKYLDSKMPRDEYYRDYMKSVCSYEKYNKVFTGSDNDLERSEGLFDGMPQYIGDIRQSLALIRDASYVVTNDSGLSHAAGAMNKNMVILWKNTKLPKNANPGKHTTIKMCH